MYRSSSSVSLFESSLDIYLKNTFLNFLSILRLEEGITFAQQVYLCLQIHLTIVCF